MRALLDFLYRLSGALAAVGMVATLAMVSAGILSRPFGLYLPGTDDYAGYAMAACGFLALAYTFKHGEHIRVSLVLERLGPRARRVAEWFAHAAGTAVAAMLAWYALRLVWQSHEFEEISQGVDAFKADGDGFYDILLSFSSGGNVNKTFTQGDILEYTISAPGLTATSFDFLSAPAGGHGPFHLAAHIQNTGGGEDSGWVTDSTGGSLIVPEPTSATLALLAMSMLLVALSRHWRPV